MCLDYILGGGGVLAFRVAKIYKVGRGISLILIFRTYGFTKKIILLRRCIYLILKLSQIKTTLWILIAWLTTIIRFVNIFLRAPERYILDR